MSEAVEVDLSDLDVVRRHIENSSWPNKPLCFALVAELERLREAIAAIAVDRGNPACWWCHQITAHDPRCPTLIARRALDQPTERPQAPQDVWVSVWKHGPMEVFQTKADALNWNVMRPRTLEWDAVTDTDLHGYVESKRVVQVHRRQAQAPQEES